MCTLHEITKLTLFARREASSTQPLEKIAAQAFATEEAIEYALDDGNLAPLLRHDRDERITQSQLFSESKPIDRMHPVDHLRRRDGHARAAQTPHEFVEESRQGMTIERLVHDHVDKHGEPTTSSPPIRHP